MKRNDRAVLFIILAVVVGLVVVLYFIFPRGSNGHYNWNESYLPESDQPYGTSVIKELLDGYFDDYKLDLVQNDIKSYLENPEPGHKSYIFIGWKPYITDSTLFSLANFVQHGNDAFFAMKEIPESLSDLFYGTEKTNARVDSILYTTEFGDTIWYQKPDYTFDTSDYSYFLTDKMILNFVPGNFSRDSGWAFQFHDWDGPAIYEWRYFVPSYLERVPEYDSIGSVRSVNFLNYISIPYGKGHFYIYLAPVTLTNYFQIEEKNIEYTSKLFSFLKPGDIIWDEASRLPEMNGDGMDFNSEKEGPLKYILSQQSLRWSWYVILSGLLIFLLFRTKRTQRPIPVLEPNENKSLEFIQTIGRMYFISKNHRLIAQQKMKLFLHFISNRYSIPVNEINDEFYNRLNLKSEIPVADIKTIFSHFRYIEDTNDVTTEDLIYFHQLLNSFYKTCK